MWSKLGCENVLELALLTPRGYDNHILSSDLHESPLVVEVCVIKYAVLRKVARVHVVLPAWNCYATMLIFNHSAYHASAFAISSRHVIRAKAEWKDGLTLIQPKVLKQTECILPLLPIPKGVSKPRALAFIQSQINTQALMEQGVPCKYAQAIALIYHPTLEFARAYKEHNGFKGESLEALKFLEIFNFLRKRPKPSVFYAPELMPRPAQDFIDSLPVTLTRDQKNAITDIENDLKGAYSARRVVMGDVGCGKSFVMFAAAYMVYPKRSILLAPTSLLAHQLYTEAQKYLPNIHIELILSGKKPPNFMNAHMLIGTHALLFCEHGDDVVLIMIDEQHRFGVRHRNMLAKMPIRPHVIQFSATPIPRTQAMIESHFIRISYIKQRPFERKVHTHIIKKADFKNLLTHLHNEIKAGRQAAIIYPLREESEHSPYRSISESQAFWEHEFGRVHVTHSKDKNKESVLLDFRDNGTILLTTTVIEVGISLPRLCTIVISGAERFGLATLHQLRGRVSRSGLEGHCYLFTHSDNTQRLEAFAATHDGFEIAELDLSLRKSGDIMGGERQSGMGLIFFDPTTDGEILEHAKQICMKESRHA